MARRQLSPSTVKAPASRRRPRWSPIESMSTGSWISPEDTSPTPGRRNGPKQAATGNISLESKGRTHRAGGSAGIRDVRKRLVVPSHGLAGGINLGLFSANLGPADLVVPHDPDGKLPMISGLGSEQKLPKPC